MKTIPWMTIIIAAVLLVTSCSTTGGQESGTRPAPSVTPQVPLPTVSLAPVPAEQQSGDETDPAGNQPKVKQAPFSLPKGYQVVETTSFKIAIPNGWSWKKKEDSESLLFQKDGKDVGETEILGWFDTETWKNMRPNHADQTDFQKVKDLISMGGVDVHVYRIQLTHTKPAAAQDPDWEYRETRWYVAIKENNRAFGFYFSSEQVNETTMKTIISSFRLKT